MTRNNDPVGRKAADLSSDPDDDIRLREIEDARAGGYAQGRADTRVVLSLLADELRMMPEVWVTAYGMLVAGALNDGLEGKRASSNPLVKPRVLRVRTNSGQRETRGLASKTKPSSPQSAVEVRSNRLLALKSRIDRKLRALAREIVDEMDGRKNAGAIRKCTRCKKYGEDRWNWCPYDGSPMESNDQHS